MLDRENGQSPLLLELRGNLSVCQRKLELVVDVVGGLHCRSSG